MQVRRIARRPRPASVVAAAARRAAGVALAFATAAAASAALAGEIAGEIAGIRPGYTDRALSEPPNASAIRARMWVPEIDLGFVPQGLTVVGDAVLLSAYNSEGGPPKCRLYRVDRRRLVVTGRYDLPSNCGHAGGLAYAGGDRLFVSDTWRLYEVDLGRALDAARAPGALVRSVSLRFPLRGSFVAYRDGALWIGEHKKPQPGAIRIVPVAALETVTDPPGLGPEHAIRSLEVAPMSQGAAFDRNGHLWLSLSFSQSGSLQKVDPASGRVLASFAVVAGIEDLDFDADGILWSVGEAGSRRWHNWPTFYPLLFSIDVEALR
ncbi:MAG: hypothetical protein JSW68_01820 [Burkholderiales bacterium]|nr:MAG: hypothetical protein JSW68_01820 [Burkholderiales bacterium]